MAGKKCPMCNGSGYKEGMEAGERKEYKKNKRWEDKVGTVMREFDEGTLRSGSKKGPKVKKRRQAIAIGLSEANKQAKRKRKKK